MRQRPYTVQVNDIPACYKRGYFPRRFRYKNDAIVSARNAIANGASMATIEQQDGVDIVFKSSKPAVKPPKPWVNIKEQ